MKLGVIMKRFYTNRDLIGDRYGRMFHLPRELVERGWRVEVFCPDFLKGESFSLEVEGVGFHSIPARFAGNWMSETPWINFDANIWLASGQFFAGRQARAIARLQSVPWTFDCYDYYPAFFPRITQPWVKWWGRRLIASCDGVIGASEALVSWAKADCSNTICIGNGVDRSVFRPSEKSAVRKKYGLEGAAPVIGYFGSLDADRGLYEAIAAIESLREAGSPVRLVCAGRCSDHSVLDRVQAKWLGMLKQEDLAEILSACDCALAPYSKGSQVEYSSSCRISEYLACGTPVIATRTGDYRRFFSDDYRGLAKPGDAQALVDAIRSQIDDPEVVPLRKEREWQSLGGKLDRFLKDTIDQRG